MIYHVYILCDPRHEDRPFYVGRGIEDRAKVSASLYEASKNDAKYTIIKELRDQGLQPTIIYHAENLTEQEANELEAQLIAHYGRIGIDEGGVLTNICPDWKPPVSYGPLPDEVKQKIGDAQRGEKNHRFGVSWSDDEKKRRSEFNKTHGIKPPVRSGPMSEEQKTAIGLGNLGKKRSPEVCAYLSLIRKGKTRKPPSEETKQKIRESNIRTKAARKAAKMSS